MANQKLEQLATENESLKRLLRSLGLHDDFLVAYSNAAWVAPTISQAILKSEDFSQARPCLSPSLSLSLLQPHMPQGTECERVLHSPGLSRPDTLISEQEPQNSIQTDDTLAWELTNFLNDSACLSEQTDGPTDNLDHLTMESLMAQAFTNAVPAYNVSDTTSLCSWAFSLVLKSNLKGYSTTDLDLKLRAGYRHGATPTEGCRIDNKILLNVLAEVM
ncbi:hypothetical protein BKA66DRAFT_570567 [Pyrenochaeta sp. MPI-SDFR-AT-0127]|nr:hypothetical protein BKA66DRAFT_570567 [Pyrenochaeta sp. MPI-SDFR-AT-0127]